MSEDLRCSYCQSWRQGVDVEVCGLRACLLDNLPGMVYHCANDPGWTMLFVSEGARDLTGYPPEQLIAPDGVRYSSLIHPEDRRRVWVEIQHAVDHGQAYQLEYRILAAGGAEKWVWEKGHARTGQDHQLTLEGFIEDITEHKRYEAAYHERLKLKNQLQQLQKADSLNRMTGAIAHHFNNKLHGVISTLELAAMERDGGDNDEESLSAALATAREAASMSRLMLTCLGQDWQARTPVQLNTICREVWASHSGSLPGNISLDLDLPEQPLWVETHEHAVRKMVETLITNALEAEATTRVRLRLLEASPGSFGEGIRFPVEWVPEERDYAVVEVTDNGPGISATMVEQIFDPFFSTKFTGRGLGLTLVLGQARAHGGCVIVNSKLDRGSVFRVFLPLEAGKLHASDPDHAAGSEAATATNGKPKKTVLVVEDETPMRELTCFMLSTLGCRSLAASDGRAALRQVELHAAEIDIVLCDIRMPHLDGWHTLEALRRKVPEMPVILVSGYEESMRPPADIKARPDGFLKKPYMLTELCQLLTLPGAKG